MSKIFRDISADRDGVPAHVHDIAVPNHGACPSEDTHLGDGPFPVWGGLIWGPIVLVVFAFWGYAIAFVAQLIF